jgi:hypothetical protein
MTARLAPAQPERMATLGASTVTSHSRARASAAILVLAGLLAGCAGPAPSPGLAAASDLPTASAAPIAAAPSASLAPTATPAPSFARPSLPPGAPPIADPYWLLATGTSTGEWKDADGTITRTDTSTDYTVIEGGSLEGTVLLDGVELAFLSYTVSAFPSGVDPGHDEAALLELAGYGDLDGVPTPTPDGRVASWERRQFGTVLVVLHAVTDESEGVAFTQAFWWASDQEGWYQLQDPNEGIDLAPILQALLGDPAS